MKILSTHKLIKQNLLFVVFVFTSISIYAQPSVLGSNVADVSNYATYNTTDLGNFKQQRIQAINSSAASVRIWEFAQGTAGSPDYSTNWRPYTSGNTLSANTFIPVGFANGARYNTGSGGQSGLLPAITSGNYYTFNVSENSAADNVMQLLETNYNPVSISSATQSPAGSFVNSSISPTITATISAALSSGEGVFIRWSTDMAFSSSSIVAMTGSGTTYSGSIPAQGAGITVYYYLLSSNKSETQLNSDKSTYGEAAFDMGTLNLKTLIQSGSGNTNYSYTSASNPVVVNSTGGTASASYATLKAAFDAINAGTHTTVISILIEGNTTETTTASLNASGSGSASYSSINLQPIGAQAINGNFAASLITLNGADNITIDGLNTGGNSLAISNSNTAASATILLQADATSNLIQHATVKGSSASSGVIVFGNATSTGNDNNTINQCTITAEGSNLPLYGIRSSSSSGETSGVSISNNNISDYFSATIASAGISIGPNNSTWTISANRLFQSASRSSTAVVTHRGIFIDNTAGIGFTINDNIIGFANASGTGSTIYTSIDDTKYAAIDLNLNTSSTHNLQGNIISGISFSSTPPAGFSNSNFYGIALNNGIYNIGTTTGNTIGAATGTGAITITSLNTNTILGTGIYIFSGTGTINCQNNNIGSITMNVPASGNEIFYGFVGFGTRITTVSSNTIGSTSTASSISLTGGSGFNSSFVGINLVPGNTITCSGNTIQNIANSGAASSSGFLGIFTSTTGIVSISGNNILNITHAGTSDFYGIRNTGNASALTIDGNILRNIIIASTPSVFGILNDGSVSGAINITNNQLGNSSGGFITYNVIISQDLNVIYNQQGSSSATLNITGNDIRGITYSAAASSQNFYILNTAATLSQNISTNTFTNLTVNTSGGITFIQNSVSLTASGTKTINNNSISGSFSKTGIGGSVYFYLDIASSAAGAVINNNDNNFSNITLLGFSFLSGWENGDGASGAIKNIQNNTFSSIVGGTIGLRMMQITNGTGSVSGNTITNCTAQGPIVGIRVSSGSFNIFSNTITDLSNSSSTFAGVTGLDIQGGTTQNIYQNDIHSLTVACTFSIVTAISVTGGTTISTYNNKIYGLANNSSSFISSGVVGINVGGGTTNRVYNNLIGSLTVSTVGVSDAIRGIGISSGSGTVNVSNNTIYLSGTSAGSGFGSSCLYSNTGPTVVLLNNIFVNLSTPTGTGSAVAYRRNGTTLTSYSTTSNNNLYYAGIPSSTHLIFFDGTNSDRDLSAMQTRITTGNLPRDLNSVTENPNFLSTIGSDANFLKINPATPTQIESRGTAIAGISDDYNGDIRNISTPDIGADEFTGTASSLITVTSASGSAAPTASYGSLTAAVLAINQTTSPYHGGAIVCTVQDGFIETAPAGGYVITREGSLGNTITFTKSGSGSNPVFTAFTPQTSGIIMDAVFKLVGADYVTIEKFTLQENASNATTTSGTNNMTEFGIGLFYSTTSNGAQNNTIQNNTISLNRAYSNSFGIYATTRHSSTSGSAADIISSGGANNNNKIYANIISNVNNGIAFSAVSSASNMDLNNDIGGSSIATGNMLTNCGGQIAAGSYNGLTGTNFGIWMNHQPGGSIAYNSITSATGLNLTGSLYGIRLDYSSGGASGTVTNNVSNNTITLNGTASITFRCIDLGATAGTNVSYNIVSNSLLNNVVTGTSTSFSGILSSAIISKLTISGNVIQGTTSTATTGGFTGISNTGTVSTTIDITSNEIGNSIGNAITFSNATSGLIKGIEVSGGAGGPILSVLLNNFEGFVQNVIGSGAHNYILVNSFTASNTHSIQLNSFTNLDANTSGDVYFIQDLSSMAASKFKSITTNNISGTFIKRAGAGFSSVYFFSDGSAASAASSSAIFFTNDFSNVTINGNTYLGGWFTQDGPNISKNIQNNIFRNISGGTNALEIMTVKGSGSATITGNTIRGISGGGSSVTGLILGTGTQNATSNTIRNLRNSGGLVRAILNNAAGTNTIQSHTIDSIYTTAANSIALGIDISAGTTVNISKNKIYDIANTRNTMTNIDGAVNGIRVSAGTTVNINNNLIGDLKATIADDVFVTAVRGVNIGASSGTTSTTNLYYNTIYLNTSGGAHFGSTAVYQFASSTSASFNLDMRNNILVNLSTPSGAGVTTAFRRSSNTSLNNYSANSNNNLFYAGIPSTDMAIFSDGTLELQTITDYINSLNLSPRDNASVTENVTFISTIPTDPNFLHVDVTNPTVVESGGTTATISPTGDYDGNIRFGEGSYVGSGTATDIGADEIVGINTSAYYFRTKSTGTTWKSPTYWEFSPDGVSWSNATSYPTSASTKINIRNGHSITIPASVTANALQIDNGGILNQTNGFSLIISNGSGNDGSGYDFIVENGGIYVINGTRPVFNTGATAEIRNGGVVRADGNSSPNQSDDFAYQTDANFRTGSVFQWNNSNAFQTSAITYFQNSTVSDIPIFRLTTSIGTTLGATLATTFNGKFECNSGTATWTNSGTKTFRNGLGGTATITHNSSCGTFSITGTLAAIDGSVTLNIDNTGSTLIDLQIANNTSCIVSGSPTINIGTASSTGGLFTVDGIFSHLGSVPINFQTGSGDFTVNGSYGGTGTLTLNSATSDIIIGGTSGGSAGTFSFTSGASNNTANSLNFNRTGSGASMTLGSDFGVTNGITLATGSIFNIGAYTLTGNGTISGAGTLNGGTSSNLTIGGTGGSSFGTLLFTPGAQTLNNFTMGRTGSSAAVTLGAANNLTVSGVCNIANSAATVVIGANTFTMNGTLTGAGTFTGSSSSNITVGGTVGGSLGTMQFASGARTLNTLTVSRTGSGANAVLGSDLSITNLLDITNASATLSIASNTLTLAASTITGSGSLFGTSSSNLTMTGSGQVGTLRFATGGQLLNTLSLDRTAISNNYAVLMASPLTVNAMTLTNGIIATGANLFTWTKTGSLLPAAQTSYTANSTTYKNSYLCLCDASGTALSFTAPFDAADNIGFQVQNVGNNVWLPVGVDFNAPNRMWIDNSGSAPLGTADDITVLLAKGDIGGTDKPVVRRIWYAYEGSPGGTKANMRLYFTKQDPAQFGISQDEVETGFDQTDVNLTQKNYGDPNYIDVAQSTDVLSAVSNTIGTEVYGQYSIGVSPDVNTLTDGINQFSRFTVMNISTFILPVTITKVEAVLQQDATVNISWTALQETNIGSYEVQRSIDAIGFESIGRATARNTGALEQVYGLKDLQPLSGNNFYRIKIVEKDGKISYSNVVLVVNGSIAAIIKVQPNFISGTHTGIQFTNTPAGKYELTLYSLSGGRLWKQTVQHGGGSAYYDLWLPAGLPNATYIVQIMGEGGLRLTQKIVVQQ